MAFAPLCGDQIAASVKTPLQHFCSRLWWATLDSSTGRPTVVLKPQAGYYRDLLIQPPRRSGMPFGFFGLRRQRIS